MPNSPTQATKQQSGSAPQRSALVRSVSTHTPGGAGMATPAQFADPVHRNIAGLQRTSGNQAVSHAIGSGAFPGGIPVGPVGDRHEQEADRVAEGVLKERTADRGAPRGSIANVAGGGQTLGEADREFFESRFGTDFGGVRVYTGTAAEEAAASLHANAFTVGPNIVFGAGKYAPGNAEGRRLLAHELTHVVQQSAVLNGAGISGRSSAPVIQRDVPKDEKPPAQQGTAAPKAETPAPGGQVEPKTEGLSVPRSTVMNDILPKVMGGMYQTTIKVPDPDFPDDPTKTKRVPDPKHSVSKEAKDKWKALGNIDVEAQRAAQPGYTTCGALPQHVVKRLGIKDHWIASGGLYGVAFGDPTWNKDGKIKAENDEEAKKAHGPRAWVDKDKKVHKGGARGMGVWVENTGDGRPKAGDIYLLGVVGTTPPQIKHIGIFVSATDNGDGTETWETADAGQGVKAQQKATYSKKEHDVKQGEQPARIYNKNDKTVTGMADKGTVLGWVDLEALVKKTAEEEAAAKKEAEEKAAAKAAKKAAQKDASKK